MELTFSYIIPCYYNEPNIPVTFSRLLENEKLFGDEVAFEYVFVDDGSKDNTWAELQKIHSRHPEKVRLIRFGKNVGSYIAITAGMKKASGDINVVVSADLQDPVELTFEMFKYWKNGFKLVIGQRANNMDGFVSKRTSKLFNSLMRKYAISDLPKGGFDFVLFDKIVKEQVLLTGEKNTNILYLMFILGYPTATIPYVREERKLGKSRWTFKKKMKLFIDSFIAFSFVPIRILSVTGLVFGFLSLVYSIYILINKLIGNIEIEGWSALMITVLFIGSFQMIGLGILGEYLWRVLDEVRNRPQYTIIDEH
ncbi:glycosyltransferase family 2 protein [Fluviicola sp.]|uniref:glycosyltransferase family 2 protein n=1 Tax=Fluviicola sp. TaxID=1917219 RepID=UPI0031D1682C